MSKIFRQRLQSFRHAFSGIFYLLGREPNYIIHTIAAILVIAAGFVFSVTRAEWIILVLTIGIVMATEALNTSIEKICDRFLTEKDDQVKIIKDAAAAAVLIVSICAAIVGVIVFLPYVLQLFRDQ